MERYRYFFESILNALIKDCWGGMKNEIDIMSNQIESVWYLISVWLVFFIVQSKMSVIIPNFEKV